MKQHDTAQPLLVTARYEDPTVGELDITPGTTVVMIMTRIGASTPTVNRAAAEVVSSADGVVTLRYVWAALDVATAGRYRAEFELSLLGKPLTIPTDGYITVVIEPDLG